MLGVNQRDRNTPDTRSTTKLHRAISPSMNDQWSGKTFRRYRRPSPDRLSRSSAQPATAPAAPPLPCPLVATSTSHPITDHLSDAAPKGGHLWCRLPHDDAGCCFVTPD